MNAVSGRLVGPQQLDDAFLTLSTPDGLRRLHLTDAFPSTFSTDLQHVVHNVIHGVDILVHNVDIQGTDVVLTPASLIVVEPNVLVDVTDVADCFLRASPNPEALPLVRAASSRLSESMVVGTLINGMVDALVSQPDLSDDDVFGVAVHQRPLQTALVARDQGTWDKLSQQARATLPALRYGLQQFAGKVILAEPTFLSPKLGLQGRLDFIIRSATNPNDFDIVELKSGAPPTPSLNNPHPIRPSHQAQAAAYSMMVRLANPSRRGNTSVWYPRSETDPFRAVTSTPNLEQSIVDCRNALVIQQLAAAHRLPSSLGSLKRHVAMLVPDYARNEALDLAASVDALAPTERLYIRAWSSFLHNEILNTHLSEGGTAELWSTTLAKKRLAEGCLTDLVLDPDESDIEALHLRFRRLASDAKDTSLRLGDPVVVLRHADVDPEAMAATPILKGTIRDVTTNHVDVSLRNKLADRDALLTLGTSWLVEREASVASLKSLAGALPRWARTPSRRRQTLLGLHEPSRLVAPTIDADGLYPQQLHVVQQALAAQDWFLIQGPPGTGKTSAVLRRLVHALYANPNERIWLLAYTNRAADEICHVVERSLGSESYIRLASKDGAGRHSAHRHLSALASQHSPTALSAMIANCRCVVATIASMNTNTALLDALAPTTVIVDEASQVLEPHLLPIASAAGRLILIGDECQLPAVIAQQDAGLVIDNSMLAEICLDTLGQSFFERLMRCAIKNGWHHSVGRLTEQGRMHERIGSVVGRLFYGGTLTATQPWQRSAQPWRNGSSHPVLQEVFENRMVYIDSDHYADAGIDPALRDATVAANLASLLIHEVGDVSPSTVGMIAPFRSQNFRIRSLLPAAYQSSITVDTVERFQGSERDVMIIAASVASMADLDSITSLAHSVYGLVDRKLNVAVSRARECCIIVGSRSILSQSPSWSALLNACHSIPANAITGM